MIKSKFQITYFYRYYFRIEIYLRISRNNRNEETNRGTPSLSFVATLNGVDLLHASWSSLQPVPGTLSTCRYSAPGHHVDFMRFYSHNYRTALQKSVVFVVDLGLPATCSRNQFDYNLYSCTSFFWFYFSLIY